MNQQKKLLVPGLLLIIGGILIFTIQWQGWKLDWVSWPFYLLIPGLLVVIISLFLEEDTGEGLCIFGSILTTIGGILLFQQTTGLWDTWAYMWALIPLSVGVGQLLHALIYKNRNKSLEGLQTFRTGLILFVVFAAGFELLIFKRKSLNKSVLLAVLFILAGLLIIFQSKNRKKEVVLEKTKRPEKKEPVEEAKKEEEEIKP